MIDLIYNT